MDYTNCECGKRGYESRRTAKKAHRMAGARLRFYCCRTGCWHATNDEKNNRAGWRRQVRAA
ncbi:MAG TPA: hypothetical protein VFH61_17870 [Thermoleophilia bacterium]|nr:hypothetical protein [Thermoleophilia bacterium]